MWALCLLAHGGPYSKPDPTMNPLSRANLTRSIKLEAQKLGFQHCGIAKVTALDEEARQLEQWLNQHHHGSMQYMANHFDLRIDPKRLVPGAKTVISLAYNYFPPTDPNISKALKISKYAQGKDYHKVVRKRLKQLLIHIKDEVGDIQARVFVDSAPVLEKTWAARAGVGWQGKHTNLLNKNTGSFFFLAEIISDVELEPDGPVKDHCGSCTRCLDACPTQALVEPYKIDASKCISYLTIERKEELPEQFRTQMEGWIFGCDICQDVCPWNRFSVAHQEPKFEPSALLQGMHDKDWLELTEEVFNVLFEGSAVKRTGIHGLKRNIAFVAKKEQSGSHTSKNGVS